MRIFIARRGGAAKVAVEMSNPLVQLLVRWLVLALGVALATKLVPGIRCDDGMTLVIVAILLSFFNSFLKPLLVLFTLPFILVTMGVGMIVINALLFLFAAHLVDGFHVAGFWSAVGGALVVSITNFFVSSLLRSRPPPPPRGPSGRGDVIDV
jgi:putative membrane protein